MTFMRPEAKRLLLDGCDDAATLRAALRESIAREENIERAAAAKGRLAGLEEAAKWCEAEADEMATLATGEAARLFSTADEIRKLARKKPAP